MYDTKFPQALREEQRELKNGHMIKSLRWFWWRGLKVQGGGVIWNSGRSHTAGECVNRPSVCLHPTAGSKISTNKILSHGLIRAQLCSLCQESMCVVYTVQHCAQVKVIENFTNVATSLQTHTLSYCRKEVVHQVSRYTPNTACICLPLLEWKHYGWASGRGHSDNTFKRPMKHILTLEKCKML